MTASLLLKPTITPEGGPGFSLTCSHEELEIAAFDRIQVCLRFVIDGSIPVAFVQIVVPPLGAAIYALDFSSTNERHFAEALLQASFYDIRIESWSDPDAASWISAPITDESEGPAILDRLLGMPTPSHEQWSAAADSAAEGFGFESL